MVASSLVTSEAQRGATCILPQERVQDDRRPLSKLAPLESNSAPFSESPEERNTYILQLPGDTSGKNGHPGWTMLTGDPSKPKLCVFSLKKKCLCVCVCLFWGPGHSKPRAAPFLRIAEALGAHAMARGGLSGKTSPPTRSRTLGARTWGRFFQKRLGAWGREAAWNSAGSNEVQRRFKEGSMRIQYRFQADLIKVANFKSDSIRVEDEDSTLGQRPLTHLPTLETAKVQGPAEGFAENAAERSCSETPSAGAAYQ